jgi:xanthine dehydrogenase YagS FAD-binding subunit
MRPFSLIRPTTLAAARARALAEPQARPFRAGGIDLLGLMKEGLRAPAELIELHALSAIEGAEMRALAATEGGLRVGALVSLAALARAKGLPPSFEALREAASSAATPAIREAATVGGNLLQRPRCWYLRHPDLECLKSGGASCLAEGGENRLHAILGGGPCYIVHPSTLAAPLVALAATVTILGGGGRRTLPLEELFAPPRERIDAEHRLAAGELLVALELPAPAQGQRSVYEVAKEKLSHDWPLAEVALSVVVEGQTIRGARVVLGHVAPIPWRALAVEQALVGQVASAELFARVAPLASVGARPLAQNGYKVALAQGLVRAALHRACDVPIPE